MLWQDSRRHRPSRALPDPMVRRSIGFSVLVVIAVSRPVFQYASTHLQIVTASARPVGACESSVCPSAYRCSASYSHLSNRRSPLNGRTKISLQRIKPPQPNRPLHRYPVPGFQRVVKRLWSRFFCNFSLAKQRKVCFQFTFRLLVIVFASARQVSAC